METLACSETSVRNYHKCLRNNPEESTSYLLRDGNLKSRNVMLLAQKEIENCMKYLVRNVEGKNPI